MSNCLLDELEKIESMISFDMFLKVICANGNIREYQKCNSVIIENTEALIHIRFSLYLWLVSLPVEQLTYYPSHRRIHLANYTSPANNKQVMKKLVTSPVNI